MRKRLYTALSRDADPEAKKQATTMASCTNDEAITLSIAIMNGFRFHSIVPRTRVAPMANGVPIPTCHNIVSTSHIVCSRGEINLQRLAVLLPCSRYDKKRFAAITIRIDDPCSTGLLFSSGKLVITGSVSFNNYIASAHAISRMLREINPGVNFQVNDSKIQNIVSHCQWPSNYHINIEQMYKEYSEWCTYQKSIFPGLVLRPPDSPIVLLIFLSGRVVCTGGKSYEDIYIGWKALYPFIEPFVYCVDDDGGCA